MKNINIRVMTLTIDVNIPIFFDLVHPDNAINIFKDTIPNSSENPPIFAGSNKSPFVILKGNPSVVIIKIFVKANTEIKKKLAAKTETFNIFLDKRVLVSETKRFATIAIEKPPKSELIIIIWLASVFQFGSDISAIYMYLFKINSGLYYSFLYVLQSLSLTFNLLIYYLYYSNNSANVYIELLSDKFSHLIF